MGFLSASSPDQRTGRVAAVSLQFGRLSAPSHPQAVHRSLDPIAGTSTSSDRTETSTTAEWWQLLLWQYAAIVRTPFARMFPSIMGE